MEKEMLKRIKVKALTIMISIAIILSAGVIGNITLKSPPDNNTVGYFEDVKYIENSNGKLYTATETNLQRAIWDLNSSNGGEVILPEGTITLTSRIELIHNLTLLGRGKKTILYTAGDIDFLYFKGDVFPADRGVIIRDIWFEGTASHASSAIHLDQLHHWAIESCYFKNVYYGIYLKADTHDVDNGRVANNHFNYIDFCSIYGTGTEECVVTGNIIDSYGAHTGIRWGGHRCTISDNTIEEVWDTGVESHVGYGIQVTGDDNVLSGNTVRESGNSNLYIGGERNVITGNHFSDNYYNAGVYVTGTGHTITGNTIGDCDDESGTPDAPGIDLSASSDNVTVSSNYISNVDQGIYASGKDHVIMGNTIYNSAMGMAGSADRLLVVGNTIKYTRTSEGMYFTWENSTISNNKIIDADNEGIQPTTGANYNMIFGNYIENCGGGGINTYGNHNVIYNNDLRQQSSNKIVKNGADNIYYDNWGALDEGNFEGTKIWASNGQLYDCTNTDLQTAINDLGNSGGTIVLPECNITITSTLALYNKIKIMGQGHESILYMDTASDDILAFDGRTKDYPENRGIHVDSICFQSDLSNEINGLRFTMTSHAKITNCWFENIDHGVVLDDGVGDVYYVTVDNNHFYNIGDDAIITDADVFNCSITNNIIDCQTATADQGIYIQGTNNTIDNNVVENVNKAGGYGIYLSATSSANIVSNNVIRKTYSNCVRVSGSGNSIIGNTISDNENNAGVYLFLKGHIVSDNIVKNIAGNGIDMNTDAEYINIIGNEVSNTAGAGITVNGDYVTVTGNTIHTNTASDGITGSGNWVICSNNIIHDKRHGIYCTWDNSTISFNLIKDCTNEGIQPTDGAHFVTVMGNILINNAEGIDVYGADVILAYNDVREGDLITDHGTRTVFRGNYGWDEFTFPTSAPAHPVAGSAYVNTTTGDIAVYSGSGWLWNN